MAGLAIFGAPWLSQALLTARRGPTFAFAMVVLMGWYLNRHRRPPAVAVVVSGFLLGWLVLFLVANRGNIYLGSDFDVADIGCYALGTALGMAIAAGLRRLPPRAPSTGKIPDGVPERFP